MFDRQLTTGPCVAKMNLTFIAQSIWSLMFGIYGTHFGKYLLRMCRIMLRVGTNYHSEKLIFVLYIRQARALRVLAFSSR